MTPTVVEAPMFPLGTVLLPGAVLPLHVFEPRYRDLVRVCMAGDREFGVTLIERGSEVGGGDVRVDVGCMARILEADALPDGRWILATTGQRRIRVRRWLPDAPYPRAEVVDWPDEPAGPGTRQRCDEVLADLRRVLARAAELGEAVAPSTVEIATEDPVLASHQLTALAPLGPLDRLRLLATPGPDERLDALGAMLGDLDAMLARRLEGG
jgi:uncharacterized protein